MRSHLFFASLALFGGAASTVAAQDKAPTSRVADVQWPETSGPAAAASAATAKRLPEAKDVRLPVLMPLTFFKYKSLALVGEPLQYAASVRGDGASLSITGTRLAIDSGVAAPSAGAEAIDTDLGEKSAQATTVKYGAAYLVTVECDRENDPRCANADYAVALLRSADMVGGTQDGAPPPAPTPPASSGVIGAASSDPAFKHEPPGRLLPGSGKGVASPYVFAPGIRFPVALKPAYLNSQVWGVGGTNGAPGSWKSAANYQYPWHDNFCETRSRRTAACPSGTGHQGVDIRPADARDQVHWAVAAETGRIIKVGTYSVTLAGTSGTHFNYLHLEMAKLKVKLGDRVVAGQQIGLISNDFAGTPTPVHLHFEMMQNRDGKGWSHVPPYASLVDAYGRL